MLRSAFPGNRRSLPTNFQSYMAARPNYTSHKRRSQREEVALNVNLQHFSQAPVAAQSNCAHYAGRSPDLPPTSLTTLVNRRFRFDAACARQPFSQAPVAASTLLCSIKVKSCEGFVPGQRLVVEGVMMMALVCSVTAFRQVRPRKLASSTHLNSLPTETLKNIPPRW
eukprot:TRINITY_DN44484_c0_g1_i1.p1 TRINITY_DN44484_c0_g1~~TRINITY_DN44484_c0_g1_i1.p1  ORF type:complete len:168 (-),score=19.62 TRINITY_DN44484_c0_g1_i1:78-581(-)